MVRQIFLSVLALVVPVAAAAADIAVSVAAPDGEPIADAVIVAVPDSGAVPAMKSDTVEVVDQIDKEFVPYVKVVRVGAHVQFPNKDDVRHHVYSFSPAKSFELPLYSGNPAQAVLFDKPGVVRLGCNIHDWMMAYVYVSESPYFTKTGADGRAVIKNVPEGAYHIRVWHPRMREDEKALTQGLQITQGAAALAEWKLTLRQQFRPPRVPVAGESGY